MTRTVAVLLTGLLGVAAPQLTGHAHAGTFAGRNGMIAFASAGRSGVDIFTVRPDGSHLRRLVNTPPGMVSAYSDWSPNGETLAFDSDRSGNVEIYLLTATGHLHRLTHNAAGDSHPTWSPDGGRLAFESSRTGIKQVHVMSRDGSHVRQLTHFAPGAEEPAYSPTGDWVTFLSGPPRRTALFVIRPDGTGLRRLTPRWLNAGHPSWAPDGNRIVFNSNIEKANGRIWTVTLDGTLRQITTGPTGLEDFEPTYSPDGRYIAFTRYRGSPDNADIWVMRADGTSPRDITPNSAGFDIAATWAPR